MTIYVDDGKAVKSYIVSPKIAKAVMTLLEADEGMVWSKTEDVISRQAVEKITWEEPSYTDALNVLTEVREKVRALPSVTPHPKIGHWNAYELFQGGIKEEWLECSECMWSNALLIPRNYCPKCGARMMEKEDDKE